MSVNQKIEAILSDLAKENIWPLSCPLEALPEEYIVYNPELEAPEDFGDDKDLSWMHYMQIHWFRKNDSGKPVNYIGMRKKIRNLLRSAGITISEIQTFFEKDTGYTHLCFSCSIMEENIEEDEE